MIPNIVFDGSGSDGDGLAGRLRPVVLENHIWSAFPIGVCVDVITTGCRDGCGDHRRVGWTGVVAEKEHADDSGVDSENGDRDCA